MQASMIFIQNFLFAMGFVLFSLTALALSFGAGRHNRTMKKYLMTELCLGAAIIVLAFAIGFSGYYLILQSSIVMALIIGGTFSLAVLTWSKYHAR